MNINPFNSFIMTLFAESRFQLEQDESSSKSEQPGREDTEVSGQKEIGDKTGGDGETASC